MSGHHLGLAFAVAGYAVAMGSSVLLAAFLLGAPVPLAMREGARLAPPLLAALGDVLLISGFALQHSGMARRSFGAWLAARLPAHLHRAAYLHTTGAATAGLVLFWQPMDLILWRLPGAAGLLLSGALMLVAVGIIFGAIHQIGHLRFFGLAQAWDGYWTRSEPSPQLVTGGLYGLVRHPISLGWLVLIWIAPNMTLDRLIFALGLSIYIAVATRLEERDLVDELGDPYRTYRMRVPAILPRLRCARSAPQECSGKERFP